MKCHFAQWLITGGPAVVPGIISNISQIIADLAHDVGIIDYWQLPVISSSINADIFSMISLCTLDLEQLGVSDRSLTPSGQEQTVICTVM